MVTKHRRAWFGAEPRRLRLGAIVLGVSTIPAAALILTIVDGNWWFVALWSVIIVLLITLAIRASIESKWTTGSEQ